MAFLIQLFSWWCNSAARLSLGCACMCVCVLVFDSLFSIHNIMTLYTQTFPVNRRRENASPNCLAHAFWELFIYFSAFLSDFHRFTVLLNSITNKPKIAAWEHCVFIVLRNENKTTSWWACVCLFIIRRECDFAHFGATNLLFLTCFRN